MGSVLRVTTTPSPRPGRARGPARPRTAEKVAPKVPPKAEADATPGTPTDALADKAPVTGTPAAATSAGAVAPTTPTTAAVPAVPAVPAPRPSSDWYPTEIGRIPVVAVGPVVDGGRWPAKAIVGEGVEITATVFREGHDAVAATAVVTAPDGTVTATRMEVVNAGLDHHRAVVLPDAIGAWTFRVEGWSDPYGTWAHDAAVKVAAGVDVELMLAEGAALLTRAGERPDLPDAAASALRRAAAALRDTDDTPAERLAAGLARPVTEALAAHPVREHVTPSPTYRLTVERERAMVGSWYEIFPRSEGATYDEVARRWTSGTLRTAADRLPAIARAGFDVVYLTPIHPIGTTHRKGRNNSLTCEPGDPGSPYAIGAPEGGHDAIHPDLGDFADFDAFVAAARAEGLEVALDLALQCSPDHPWVAEHPEWFTTRLDGSIAYAENPPKKYQDIYPLNFDNDPEGIYAEIRRVIQVWVDHGVTAFRVDNPHTKPLAFWERLLAEVAAAHPEVIFLAEAFTRPAMMHTLAKIGFHQSYTYFTWRNTPTELAEYLEEVSGEAAAYMRPSFWPTTHDILTPYMQHGGEAAFAIRAVLAATGSPTWGVYTGYEFVENVPRPGVEEQIDNEKYEFRPRPWDKVHERGIATLLARLNAIRREHVALRRLRGLAVHPTTNDRVLCFSRRVPAAQSPTGKADTIIVVVTTDPHQAQESTIHLDLAALGLSYPDDPADPAMTVNDLLTGAVYRWGAEPFVRLDPHRQVAHILAVGPR